MHKLTELIDAVGAIRLNLECRRVLKTSDHQVQDSFEQGTVKFHKEQFEVVREERPQHVEHIVLYFGILLKLLAIQLHEHLHD